MKQNKTLAGLLVLGTSLVLASCSSTREIPAGDQLYVGLTKIDYQGYEKSEHFSSTKEELSAALACAPNGALFGSSYYRTMPYALWIWNAFHDAEGPIGKWVGKSFGKPPVLMSWVNPELRASVAQSVARAHGYFRGAVGYESITQKNPKKAKIAYRVNLGPLFTLDSISYERFPGETDSLLRATRSEAKIHRGDAFDVSTLDAERTRVSTLFRNNGFYYYQPSYASYLADTLQMPGRVQLKFQMADDVPEKARHKWYIGKVDLQFRRQFGEQLHDSLRFRHLTTRFNGRRPPIRPRVLLRDLKLRPRQLYSYDNHQQSLNKVGSTGIFSLVDFQFVPRDTTSQCDTLDLTLNCVFDKKYDFYVETNFMGKTTGRMGPGLVIGFTKRNAFRGGEKLDINLKGSYEWQTGHAVHGNVDKIHSYDYGLDASLELPRLLMPFFRRHRFYTAPSTLLRASSEVLNRAGYYKRHVVSGELTYSFQTSATSLHQFSPLILEYNYMSSHTAKFDSILQISPYLSVSMRDQFIPRMRYSYIYTSRKASHNPVFWQTTVSEASNLLSLGYMIAGRKWGEKDKTMFKNPFAQFFKIETEFRKTWKVGEHSQLVGHVASGIIWSYGNASVAPYTEQFYVGGANSIRAFTVRSIGPGAYVPQASRSSYLDQTGDIKFQVNLEYRPRLFGNLYGALFFDAGNVWALHDDASRPNSKFKLSKIVEQMAVGTGVGLRYDLDFFVIRVDWGVGLHLPYKSGFYNLPNFKDSQSIHLAIGYPF